MSLAGLGNILRHAQERLKEAGCTKSEIELFKFKLLLFAKSQNRFFQIQFPPKNIKMPSWLRRLDWLFSRFFWYRRWYGGTWEKWFIDLPVVSECWIPKDSYSGNRPPLGRGTPEVEGIRFNFHLSNPISIEYGLFN